MAGAVVAGALVADAFSKLSTSIIAVINKTVHFKSHLAQLQQTITTIKPIFEKIEKLNQHLGGRREETELFLRKLNGAQELITMCANVNRWNVIKRVHHMYKLCELDESLLKFFQIDMKLQRGRDSKEFLLRCKDLQQRRWGACGSSGTAVVPLLEHGVIGFEDQLMDLKRMLLNDSSVVIVSGGAGCGKTTLATMLYHDPDIQGIYGINIFFATISKNPNMKLVIRNILPNNRAGQANFVSDEDAIQRWGRFVNDNCKSDILLILDDVWSDTIITDLQFGSLKYKILVTSETTFKRFDTYQMRPLSDQDSINLLCYSALSERASQATNDDDDDDDDDIPEGLVDKLAKCCKKNPLALRVVGGCLEGTQVESWHHTLKKLSQATHPDLIDLSLDEANRFHLARALGLLKDEERNSPRTSTSKKFTRSYQIT